MPSEQTCYCRAYEFPHRAGGGKCKGAYLICEGCGEECTVIRVDEGYGAYEAHGRRGQHIAIVAVSDCCEADVYCARHGCSAEDCGCA